MSKKSVIELCLEIDELGKQLQADIEETKKFQKKLDAWFEKIENRRKGEKNNVPNNRKV